MHLFEQGRLCVHLFGVGLANRRLVDLLRQETPRFPKFHNLLLVQLHVPLVVFCEPVARQLGETKAWRCVGILRNRRFLIQAEAVLAEDVLTVILLETRQLVLRLNLSPVVHSFGHLFFLGLFILLGEGDKIDLFHARHVTVAPVLSRPSCLLRLLELQLVL